jgi:hypothetical protein
LATVTGSTAYANYTLYEEIYLYRSTGTATTVNWGIATSGDAAFYLNTSSWANNAFATTRYLKFTFDPGVATGSVITTATLDFQYKSNTSGDTASWYFETYNGGTLLATHGSSTTPVSSNNTTSYSTDNVTLPELTNVANANNLTIKVYIKESTGKKTQFDLVQLNLTYYLD